MTVGGCELGLAALVCFVAWGYAVTWFPTIRWVVYAFVAGLVAASVAFLALILLTSRGTHSYLVRRRAEIATAAFAAPGMWQSEVAALGRRQCYTKKPLFAQSPSLSSALDEMLAYVIRDFVHGWYSNISQNPVFENEVDRAIRTAMARIRDRLHTVDLIEVLVSRLIPIFTAHFRDFYEAEKSIRGKRLNRSVTETEELDLAIASKYRGGQLHPAASLSFADIKMVQQDYLRHFVSSLLPKLLAEKLLASAAVATIIREICACAVLSPIMQLLSDPDTWNQCVENFGRGMLQDRSTVRKLRAALDQHASPAPKMAKPTAFPRLSATDGERRFEKFIRAIRQVNNLSDARRFRSEVASQLKRDSQQENVHQVYLRRLDVGKRLLDERVQQLAAGHRFSSGSMSKQGPSMSRLETSSLVDVLRDPSGMSYFMEYMDRQRLVSLVQFWLVVDGFRNPLEDDGPEGERLPLQLPPWTDSDRLDLAQIEAAYLSRPELKVAETCKRTVRDFLRCGKHATAEQYYRARREILRAQSAVMEEMRVKHFGNFKKSDLFYQALAAEDACKSTMTAAPSPGPSSLPFSRASPPHATRPTPAARLGSRFHTTTNRRARPATDSRSMNVDGQSPDRLLRDGRQSLEEDAPNPSFDDDEAGYEVLADSVQSLEQELASPLPDTRVVQAVEQALNTIMEHTQPPTAEDLRASLFGDDDRDSIFSAPDNASRGGSIEVTRSDRGSVDLGRATSGPPEKRQACKEAEKPSLASLGLVSAASRIGVFVDDDLFGDEDRDVSEGYGDLDDNGQDDDADEVHEAAPGDLGLAEAITVLTNDIDKLVGQDAVLDSLLRKAELTNNTAELRILRKSKASLQREIRRKELQRRQYVVQESDNSLYGRSTIKMESIQVGREDDGKEFALYIIEVARNAGEKMPAATWHVPRRYSEFLDLHQKLRSRYPSVRNLDFPRRRMVMKLQSEFLRKRRAALEKYLSQLLLLPDVCRSRELRAFLSQSAISAQGQDLMDRQDKKDMITRLCDSVADGMEDILGSIPVLDQLSVAGQNLIAAATSQLNTMPVTVSEDGGVGAAEAEAELNAFDNKELEPLVKPICDLFLEVFELNRGNNWLRGRAVVVVLHQLLGGTIERKLRDGVKMLTQEEKMVRYMCMVRDSMWPNGRLPTGKAARTAEDKAKTKTEASLMLATLVPDLAASVVGRLNAQAASRRIFATLNNARLKQVNPRSLQTRKRSNPVWQCSPGLYRPGRVGRCPVWCLVRQPGIA